jgi:hypothetical protein
VALTGLFWLKPAWWLQIHVPRSEKVVLKLNAKVIIGVCASGLKPTLEWLHIPQPEEVV